MKRKVGKINSTEVCAYAVHWWWQEFSGSIKKDGKRNATGMKLD